MACEIPVDFFPLVSEYHLFDTHSTGFSLCDRKTELPYRDMKDFLQKINNLKIKQRLNLAFRNEVTVNQFIKRLLKVSNISIQKLYYRNNFSPGMVELNQHFLGNIEVRYIQYIQIIFQINHQKP